MRIAIGILLIAFLAGCDYVNDTYSSGNSGNNGGGNAIQRRILIEDFTGHKCGNCPRAAEKLAQIHQIYGDKVVSYAVHAGFFAQPDAYGIYTNDYRTPVGDDINNFFGNSMAGLPNGLVNRKEFNGSAIVEYNAWASKVNELLLLPPDAQITMTPQYTASNRSFKIDATIKALTEIESGARIVFYLTEDSIKSPQKDYSLSPADIIEYYHRHVLRGSVNGSWGNEINTSTLTEGQTVDVSYTTTIPASWNENKVSVVAVLYKSNKEVIQVEEKKIK
jgi:thiol-disulfide isomerase/thioredoxin